MIKDQKPTFWPAEKKRTPLLEVFLFSVVANLVSYTVTFSALLLLSLFLLIGRV